MAQGTFFITSRTQTPVFQTERSTELFLDVIQSYRRQHKFLLHAFVVMPDHFHIILTPSEGVTLERSVQYLKGGFSFRAKRELSIQREFGNRNTMIAAYATEKNVLPCSATWKTIP